MAFTITNEAAANSIAAGSTLALTVTATVGTMLILAVAADNAGTAGVASLSNTVTDSAGNTWINRDLTNETVANVISDGTTLGIWTCLVGAALVAGTVTVSFSPNTTAKAAIVKKVTPAAGDMVVFLSVGTAAKGSGTAWAAATVSVTSGDTIFGFVALESRTAGTSDADTTNGSWSTVYQSLADSGATATSQTIAGQHKTATATGNQTYDPSGGSSRDYAVNYIILSPFTTNDAGSFAISGTAAALLASDILTASGGSFTETGTDAAVLYSKLVSAASGAIDITGAAVAFTRTYALDAQAGDWTITGTTAALSRGLFISADAGATLVDGAPAVFVISWLLSAVGDLFSIVGTAAELLPGNENTVTPASRTVAAAEEIRTVTVAAETRLVTVAAENRSVLAPGPPQSNLAEAA